jgi:hypothetical protein
MAAEARFDGTVQRSYAARNGSYKLEIKVDDGTQYGSYAAVWSDVPAEDGARVSVVAGLPYAEKDKDKKIRVWTTKAGNENVTLIYPNATVDVGGVAPADEPYVPDDDGEEIPF